MDPSSTGAPSHHRFRIGPLLGAGTFGEVYLSTMTSGHGIEQDVAVKLLNPGLNPRSQPVSRMRDEGRMLAAINHPAILTVMDFCFLEGRIGLVTEFVPGSDLHDCIHGADPIPARAALAVIGLVADALHAAYSTRAADGRPLGLVHRDIKPANIRLTPHATVKLLDFGIAKFEDARRETATTERMAIGTPSYMAPEVQTYEVLDALPSRDVFALGCTLFEALTGQLYFEGLDAKAIVRQCNKPERFAEWRSTRMPLLARQGPAVVDLVSRMLRYDHTERPTAREVSDACHDLAERDAGESLRAWCRRHAWPEAASKTGPWSGRTLHDSSSASTVAPAGGGGQGAQAANATLAPFMDDDASGATPQANPTLIADDFSSGRHTSVGASQHETTITIQTGGGATTITPGTTQVVVVPTRSGGRPPRRRGIDIGSIAALFTAMIVLLGGVVMWTHPIAFRLALHGDWSEAFAELGLGGGIGMLDGFGGGGDGFEPLADGASAHAWGAQPTSPDAQLAHVRLDSDVAMVIRRDGLLDAAVPAMGELAIPPGDVQALARFELRGDFVDQGRWTLGAGETLRLVCDATSGLCTRR
ncbi:MAG: serine/threonine protein kinase [Alphaproteobacteria bacterium]|nr:serine/threonine protein kinase [Alphaproteobacteria bacterium]